LLRDEIEKKINKGLKTKYIRIKSIKIKSDIKIKCEWMLLNNLIKDGQSLMIDFLIIHALLS
jgi:hypothetical protein